MLSPDYSNGLANTQYPEDLFITHHFVLCFLLFCVLPLITYFKNSIWQTFVCIKDIIKCTYFCIVYIFKTSYGLYILWKKLKLLQPQDQHHNQSKTGNPLVQTSPPHEELITEVREQLIQPSFIKQIPSITALQVFDTEHLLNLHTINISIERTYSPPVICNDRAFIEFINGEDVRNVLTRT